MEENKTIRKLSECDESTIKLIKAQQEMQAFKQKVNWYACYVHPQHELQIYEYLMGIENEKKGSRRGKAKKEDLFVKIDPKKVKMECFVPVQRVKVKLSDRMVWKEKIVIPGIIFVHCSVEDREPLFYGKMKEYVVGFMSDKVKHRPQPIPDKEMAAFRALTESEYAYQMEAPEFKPGQSVLILAGQLQGHVAELVSTKEIISKTEFQVDRYGQQVLDSEGNPIPKHKITLCVRLTDMLCAKFEVDADQVSIVPKGTKTKHIYED